MKRVLGVFLGLLVAWLGLATPAAAVVQPSSPVSTVYRYDRDANPSAVTHTTSERGPPAWPSGQNFGYHDIVDEVLGLFGGEE